MLANYHCDIITEVRNMTGGKVPIYGYVTGSATITLYLFGPEELGGAGDMVEKLKQLEQLDEKSRQEEGNKVRQEHYTGRS